MAKKLNEGPSRSALSEGANRLEQMSRSFSERQGPVLQTPAAEPHAFMLSPEEAWARKYMSQGIGPKPELTPVGSIAPSAGPMLQPEAVVPASRVVVGGAKLQARPEPMGVAIGLPGFGRRRSWLDRLLRGH